MRVLVACEFSGIVRDAFIAAGHDAISCDILPTEVEGPHIQADVVSLLPTFGEYDLVIAHPPCTYLANSGSRWLYGGKGTVKDPQRWINMREGARFFSLFLESNAKRLAVENPAMHKYAKEEILSRTDKWDRIQIIQPWQFGHGESKGTQLWLRNLPDLVPTDIVEGRKPRSHFEPQSKNRWKNRSRTLKGIANAMAQQWGSL